MDFQNLKEIRPYKIIIAKYFLVAGMFLGLITGIISYQYDDIANLYGVLLSMVIVPLVLYISSLETFRLAPNIVSVLIPISFAIFNITVNSADPVTYIWLPIIPVFTFVMLNMFYGVIISSLILFYCIYTYLYGSGLSNDGVVSSYIFSQFIAVYLFSCVLLFVQDMRQNRDERILLNELHHDYLTEIYNRRGILRELERMLRYASRYQTLLSVILIDIDNFKKLNDQFGHDVGDDVLKYFANMLRLNIRESDFVGRYGGEEFLMLVPGLPGDACMGLAEKLRKLTEEYVYINGTNITASFGVTQYQKGDTLKTLLKRVDVAMYQAKEDKNSVRLV